MNAKDTAEIRLQPRLVDLTSAVVVIPADLSHREQTAVRMLIEESEKRSQIRWQLSRDWPADDKLPRIVVGQSARLERSFPATADTLKTVPAPNRPEGFRI
ncbi:MAG: hypothetical protein JSS02_29435, partial [Planctomycetes bacterium]|nr:hypothetical protein [Planctomycetota bacterium]